MAEAQQPTVVGTQHFKMVFGTVVALTVLLLAIDLGLSFIQAPTDAQRSLAEGCGTLWKAGIGTVFGLIGGKVT